MTTKFLLEILKKTSHICSDTTHKAIWQGFPVFLTGTTDKQRRFHGSNISVCSNETATDFELIFRALKGIMSKLYGEEYKPDTLMADAAEAITNGFTAAFNYESIDDFTRLMCWPYVDRACEKRLKRIKNEKNRESIQRDIYSIQLSSDKKVF